MSAAAFGVAEANGQIQYVDIDPDQVLNVGDDFEMDITGDGTPRIRPANPADLAGGNAAIVFADSAGAAFVGFSSGGFQYPLLMAEGDMIDSSQSFTTAGERGDLNYYGCNYANSEWCGDVTDGYLGITFQFSGNTHYGWIRMDTDVNGDNIMTIKDFAFEATPDTAIAAGDQGLSVEDEVFANFNYFTTQNNDLELRATAPMQNVQLHNVLGQQVINKALSSNTETISLASLNSGVYLATVTIDGANKTFKVVRK
ncbi:T9SS type A sorting domain-containing protein [Flavobacteriaceae bacterium TK19130]|nr:T9SS type A sorting domain-containing protein [Thermobacterium salinum]